MTEYYLKQEKMQHNKVTRTPRNVHSSLLTETVVIKIVSYLEIAK